MQSVKEFMVTKGKVVIIPILIVFVLVAIFIFNEVWSKDTSIVAANDGTFIQASGIVEKNSVAISSELTGIIDEVSVKEGDKVIKDQVIAKIDRANLNNQYEQAMVGIQISEKNIDSIEDQLKSYASVNAGSVDQAKSAYIAAEGEYDKLLEGASPEEIQQAEEAVNQGKINSDFLEANLNKSRILLENGAISQAAYDEAELNYNLALSQYKTADSRLALIKSGPTEATIKAVQNKMLQAKAGYELTIANGAAQSTQLQNQLEIAQIQLEQSKIQADQLKIQLDKATIKSSMDGVINLLAIQEGEFIQLGKPVAELYDPNDIEIKVYVSEANIGHVKVGQDVEIFVDSDENRIFTGEVIRINNHAEFTPKNIQTKEERVNTVFEVKIKVLDSQGVVKPGMPVDVNIKIDSLQ